MLDIINHQIFVDNAKFYPSDMKIVYPCLGLAGETGEVCDKIKKIYRDNNGEFTSENKKEIIKELGDVLWYLCAIASDLDFTLLDVMAINKNKINNRTKNGTLSGSGDNR